MPINQAHHEHDYNLDNDAGLQNEIGSILNDPYLLPNVRVDFLNAVQDVEEEDNQIYNSIIESLMISIQFVEQFDKGIEQLSPLISNDMQLDTSINDDQLVVVSSSIYDDWLVDKIRNDLLNLIPMTNFFFQRQ